MAPKCRSAKEEQYRLAHPEAAEQARKKAAFAAMVLKVDAKKAAFAANVESSSAFAAAKADEARALMVDAKKATFAKKAADEKAAFAAFKAAKAADEKAADEAPLAGTVSGTPTSPLWARCRSCNTVTRVDDCDICPLLRYLWVWGTGVRGSINGSIYLYTCILKTNPKDKILKTNPKDKS